MPVLSTNTIPASTARSDTRGRPVRPRRAGGRGGISGSISSHSSSLTIRSTQDRLGTTVEDHHAHQLDHAPTHPDF
jgi:hypothetical protein